MTKDVERFIRVLRRAGEKWQTIPLGDKVRVWETSTADAEDGTKLIMFHIAFMPGLAKGQRVKYLGSEFELLEVSDSKRLVGLELRCADPHGRR